MQDQLSVMAFVVSVLALLVSGVLTARQLAAMRGANQLPLVVDLTQELRSPAFLARERFVTTRLRAEYDPELGQFRLPPEPADHVQAVASLFNSVGMLVAYRVIDEGLAVSLFGYRAKRAWDAMWPFIDGERATRGSEYMPGFEHFVAIVRERRSESVSDKLGLRKVDRPA